MPYASFCIFHHWKAPPTWQDAWEAFLEKTDPRFSWRLGKSPFLFWGRGEGKKKRWTTMNNVKHKKKTMGLSKKRTSKWLWVFFPFQEASSEEVPEVHLEFWHRWGCIGVGCPQSTEPIVPSGPNAPDFMGQDDEGFTRDCVILEVRCWFWQLSTWVTLAWWSTTFLLLDVALNHRVKCNNFCCSWCWSAVRVCGVPQVATSRETEPRHVQAKLTSGPLAFALSAPIAPLIWASIEWTQHQTQTTMKTNDEQNDSNQLMTLHSLGQIESVSVWMIVGVHQHQLSEYHGFSIPKVSIMGGSKHAFLRSDKTVRLVFYAVAVKFSNLKSPPNQNGPLWQLYIRSLDVSMYLGHGFWQTCPRGHVPRSRHLRLSLHGDPVIDDDFSDERWLSVEDSHLLLHNFDFIYHCIRFPSPALNLIKKGC